MNIQSTALELAKNGVSVIPVKMPGKAPAIPWKAYQSVIMDSDDIASCFNETNHSLALVCGKVSGNLEVIDFDNKVESLEGIFQNWSHRPEIKEILLKHKIPVERTISKGYHVWYRCDLIQGNQKLAQVMKDDKPVTIIETRGEGGYCIAAPSEGYELMFGDITNIPKISVEERDILLSYCLREDHKYKPKPPKDLHEALIQMGWTYVYTKKDNKYYRRPGKSEGVSASFNGKDFYVFTSNAHPFEEQKPYSIKDTYKLLGFSNDAADDKKDDDSDEVKPELVSYLYKYLQDHGFYKYIVEDDFIIVQNKDNIISKIQIHHIIDYLKTNLDEAMFTAIIKKEQQLFTRNKLAMLPTLQDDFNCDTASECFLYFNNCYVRITKDNHEILSYSMLPKPIWKSKLLNRDLLINEEKEESEISKFLYNATESNYSRLRSSMGYLIHSYKDDAEAKAIIFMDEQIPSFDDDANGGTGKSLTAKYIQQYKKTALLGKTTEYNQFFYQNVEHNTELVFFDDIHKHFKFDYLFEGITGDLRVEKKKCTPFTIPFKKSPKFILTTNYSLKGTGNSFERRKYIVEFSNHYNNKWSPYDEFGHNLITQWTPEEQSRADWYAIECVKTYLSEGLSSSESDQGNAKFKQSILETSMQFVEFMMDEIEEGNIKPGVKFVKKDLYNKYVEVTEDEIKFNTFGKYINKFFMVNGLEVKNSKRPIYSSIIVGSLDKLLNLTKKICSDQGGKGDSITDSEFLF